MMKRLLPVGALLLAACSTPQPASESTLQRTDTLHLDLRENLAAEMQGVEIVHDTIRIQSVTVRREVEAAAREVSSTEATTKEQPAPAAAAMNYTPMWILNLLLAACVLVALIFRR